MKIVDANEEYRTYIWECGFEYTIDNVVCIHIGESGSHRVTDAKGVVHYIPADYKVFKFKGEIVA